MSGPGIYQEKSQVSGPQVKNDDVPDRWVSFESARQSQANVPSFMPARADSVDMHVFNQMPPGMEIDHQAAIDSPSIPLSLAGETDVSKDTNPGALRKGFTRIDMKGTDDLYTDEHTDLWYGDAGGFVERNNYLDRG